MPVTGSRIGAVVCWCLLGWVLAGSAWAASHLPDAALHIGRIAINQDDQFTTNLSVTLTLAAVDSGAGVGAMQFSNDGETWTAPEAYRTEKQWQLQDGGYPAKMNTVLKTVYVRFRSGTGKWTKAVTDSIILARSPLDIPRTAEVWIVQQRPADYTSADPLGSRRNPHVVPRTNNEVQFDSLMYSLMTNYNRYRALATGTNVLGPATNLTVLTLRLGAGTYETHGDDPDNGETLAWSPRSGWRIIGAGKYATELKAVHFRDGYHWMNVVGNYHGTDGWYDNFELSDLTVNANLHEGTNYQGRFAGCISLAGNNVQVRRVRAKNGGTTMSGLEGGLIGMHNFGAEEQGTHNLIVEDCSVVQAQVGNAYKSGMMGISGHYGPTGELQYYHNVIVRNCYINGAAYDGDTPVDRVLHDVRDRGVFGVLIGGARDALVEDNMIENTMSACYLDSVGFHSVHVRSNHFRDVCFGFDLQLGTARGRVIWLEDTYRYEGNFVELDPRYFPAGDNWGKVGWRLGFRTLGDQKGPDAFTFNRLVIENNLFQFTDGKPPEASVGGQAGLLLAIREAVVRSNVFRGTFKPLLWDNGPAVLARQADIVDSSRPVPIDFQATVRADGTVLEPYPYVLDRTLPRPTVIAGNEISFDAPLVEGQMPAVAWGTPTGSSIDLAGKFRWRTSPQDVGNYVLAFYAGTNRLQAPRRTLLTVLPPYPPTDDRWFARGLAGYWKFEEAQGTTLGDSSGNGVTINVSATTRGGRVTLGAPGIVDGSRALQLNSLTNLPEAFGIPNADPQLITALPRSYHPLLNGETNLFHPFTLSLWFKVLTQPAKAAMLAARGDGFFLNVKPSQTDTDTMSINFGNWTSDLALSTPTNISVGQWHQVVAVYDGTSAKVFVDSLLAGEDAFGQLTGWMTNRTLMFGGGYGWAALNGSMDEVVLWNRALTPGEISRWYQLQSSGLAPVINPLGPSFLTLKTGSGTVTLNWLDNASNEMGYLVQRSSDGVNFSWVASLGRNATSFVDQPPTGSSYVYRVSATNSLAASVFSNQVSTSDERPGPPQGLNIVQ